MNKILSGFIPLLLGIVVYSTAIAEIYKQVDVNGHVTYSNLPSKGATKLDIEPPARSGGNSAAEGRSKAKTPTPANFPRVDKETQSQRDDKRKQILQGELVNEKSALEESQKNYAESKANAETFRASNAKEPEKISKYDANLKRLQDDVDMHQKNLQLLQKELDSLK